MPTAITEDIILTDIDIDEADTESYYTLVKKNKIQYYLRGTYAPIAAGGWIKKNNSDIIYGVTTDGRIAKAGPNAYIKGFRAYFDLPASAEVKTFLFEDDEITGLMDIEQSTENTEHSIYNLAGQRLSKVQKGINIINGKKTIK